MARETAGTRTPPRFAGPPRSLPPRRVTVIIAILTLLVGAGVTWGVRRATGPGRIDPVEAATRGEFVALGDSYTSGEGVWKPGSASYLDGPSRGACHRSELSYPSAVARALPFKGGSASWACSGARTYHLWRNEYRGEIPQLGHVGVRTSLVTVSIGGNDIGFSTVLGRCIVRLPWSSACRDQAAEINDRLGALGADPPVALARLAGRARGARVIVVGYPRPFPARPVRWVDNLSVGDQYWLNGVVRDLDDVLGEAVRTADRRIAAAGGRGGIELLDTYDAYTGHEVTTAQPYLHALRFDLSEDGFGVSRSYHPNAAGYRRLAELVVQRVRSGPPGWRYCTLSSRCR